MTSQDPAPLVVCCGLTTLDIVQQVDRLPDPDEKMFSDSFSTDCGGPAANAALTVGALGGRARLLTMLGTGPVADVGRTLLESGNVDVIDVAPHETDAIGVSSVLTNQVTGQRAVVSTKPQYKGAVPVELDDILAGADAVLIDGHHMPVALPLARSASNLGIPVVLDGGSWKPGTELLIEAVDYALVSGVFEVPGGRDTFDYVADAGCRYAARTDGAEPIQVFSAGERTTIAVDPVRPPLLVDSLGAGDVFHGSFAVAAARLAARVPFVDLLQRAALVATESCRHRGARGWADDPEALRSCRSLVRSEPDIPRIEWPGGSTSR